MIKEAVAMLEKGCNVKHQERACSFLSGMYVRGIDDVVEKDPVQTYKFALKACEFGNFNACNHVARLHADGTGAQKSEKLAEQFRQRAKELEREIRQGTQTLRFGQGIEV